MGKKDEEQTWQGKLLFYTTAFFIMLGTFSLFAFLFLVPFIIDPAYTTRFTEFDETPAFCVTIDTQQRQGASNCSWSSCRDGCTKEVNECTQIRVNYRRGERNIDDNYFPTITDTYDMEVDNIRQARAVKNYVDEDILEDTISNEYGDLEDEYLSEDEPTGPQGNNTVWYYTRAKLYLNVKGCDYPPVLNCSIFLKMFRDIGTNFSCYYSRVDPGLVISELDMWQVYMIPVYAMAIVIVSFIISVIYLTIAYFKIYNEDDDIKNAEAMEMNDTQIGITLMPATSITPVRPPIQSH